MLDGDRMTPGQPVRRPGAGRHADDDRRRARSASTSPSTASGSFVMQRAAPEARRDAPTTRSSPRSSPAACEAIGERMGLVVERSARSPLLVEGRDFSLGIYDADGVLLEQTEYIPVLGYATAPGMRAIARALRRQRRRRATSSSTTTRSRAATSCRTGRSPSRSSTRASTSAGW